ncbi:hypothetical protein [Gallaecimonas pentaromativorans]|uniref:hypothetical protein n=1 Tax=Gallaecimonas pentaromativorans TaxID=584787 RepID=UPI003A8E5BE2
MLHKWLMRLFILLILVLLYTYGIALVMYGVGISVPKLPYLNWLSDPAQPWSLLLVALGMQLLSAPTGFAVARLEQEMPLWLAFMIAVPAPGMLLWQDWHTQLSFMGFALEPLVELASLPLWTWFWLRRERKKQGFSA